MDEKEQTTKEKLYSIFFNEEKYIKGCGTKSCAGFGSYTFLCSECSLFVWHKECLQSKFGYQEKTLKLLLAQNEFVCPHCIQKYNIERFVYID